MSEIIPQVVRVNDDAIRVTWANVGSGDTMRPWDGGSDYDDRSMQMYGVMGTGRGGVKGSCDGTHFESLMDEYGAAASGWTLADPNGSKLRGIVTYVSHIRPDVQDADINTDITFVLIAKRKRR